MKEQLANSDGILK
jgi:hypothetical protein